MHRNAEKQKKRNIRYSNKLIPQFAKNRPFPEPQYTRIQTIGISAFREKFKRQPSVVSSFLDTFSNVGQNRDPWGTNVTWTIPSTVGTFSYCNREASPVGSNSIAITYNRMPLSSTTILKASQHRHIFTDSQGWRSRNRLSTYLI